MNPGLLGSAALGAILLLHSSTIVAQAAPKPPRTGAEVLERMHAVNAPIWYKTLTMVQKNTAKRSSGGDVVQTWNAMLRYSPERGPQLRIDTDSKNGGSGSIITVDSTYMVQQGRLVLQVAQGSKLLALMTSVYLQPVDRTLRQLAGIHVDMGQVLSAKFDGRATWIVGARSATDVDSPQFWIDVERQVVVRMITRPSPQIPPVDIRLSGYVPVGKGWVPMRVETFIKNALQQVDEYSDPKVDVPLDPRLFDPPKLKIGKPSKP
jgi:hypothetical protein